MMNGSRLLIEESPLQVLPSLAKAIGLNEAIFLQQLHYRVRVARHEADGKLWVKRSVEEWGEEMPFWSLPTIRRIISALKAKNLVLSRDDLNDHPFDRTTAYAIDYGALNALFVEPVINPYDQLDHMQDANLINSYIDIKEDLKEEEAESDQPLADHMGQSPEAPAPPPQSPEAVSLPAKKVNKQLSAFVQAYQHIWGMMVSSAYEGETIASWESRVTLEGWEYALKESANANARNWKYLTRVLERIEREGIKSQPSASSPAQPKPSSVVDFSLKDILP